MKNLLLISLASAMCVVACGEKTTLELKAREMTEQPNPPTDPSLPTDQLAKKLNLPENAENRILPVSAADTRNITIGNFSLQTTVLCTNNVAQHLTAKERIKIQGGSQIMIRQIIEVPPPMEKNKVRVVRQGSKPLISFSCKGDSADLNNEPENKLVNLLKVETGKKIEVRGKFSSMSEESLKATLACLSRQDMAEGDKAILVEAEGKGVDILMAQGSKMIFEVEAKEAGAKAYVLLLCDKSPAPAATPNPTASDDSAEQSADENIE